MQPKQAIYPRRSKHLFAPSSTAISSYRPEGARLSTAWFVEHVS
ncbi:MAG TPA: hypothetical protein VL325_10375 [Pyrinomonadaceae bacterium]|nr:hypothetical protein [Pyrinomonadaceae bacterium]